MVNSGHKLTIDELIVTYLIEKSTKGHIPEITEKEFMDFLKYFMEKKVVEDVLFDYNKLINRFLERTTESYWHGKPHMEFTKDGILKLNYKFSKYDKGLICSIESKPKESREIHSYITKYLETLPKRSLDLSKVDSTLILEECKLSGALIMECIWRAHIKEKIRLHLWPSQCVDIIKYLLEDDLAPKIDLESERERFISFYEYFAKSISILLQNDPNLKICSFENSYLSYSNYRLIEENDPTNLLSSYFNTYRENLKIDYSTSSMSVSVLDDYERSILLLDNQNKLNKSVNFRNNNSAKRLVKAIQDNQ